MNIFYLKHFNFHIDKPTISLSPTSPNATYGDVVTLQCSANGGYPTPSITVSSC